MTSREREMSSMSFGQCWVINLSIDRNRMLLGQLKSTDRRKAESVCVAQCTQHTINHTFEAIIVEFNEFKCGCRCMQIDISTPMCYHLASSTTFRLHSHTRHVFTFNKLAEPNNMQSLNWQKQREGERTGEKECERALDVETMSPSADFHWSMLKIRNV